MHVFANKLMQPVTIQLKAIINYAHDFVAIVKNASRRAKEAKKAPTAKAAGAKGKQRS